jgi:DNA replication protein DnaC
MCPSDFQPPWLKPFVEKVQQNQVNEIVAVNHHAAMDADERFEHLAKDIGIVRYARELKEIESGKLKDFPMFKAFRKYWDNRKHARDGAIIYGGEGVGKSVIAVWACRWMCRNHMPFDFIDSLEIAQVIRQDTWDRYNLMGTTGLLVVDECGDVDDIRGTPFAYLKLVINRRYRNDLPTLLLATISEQEFRQKWGPEIIDRFSHKLGAAGGSGRKR